MSNSIEMNRLLSHYIAPAALDTTLKQILEQIKQRGDIPPFTTTDLQNMLDQLAQFDFGRYLIRNRGINGYWTHYMLMHPRKGRLTEKNNREEAFTELESFILNRAPTMLATQQRFELFLQENQTAVKEGAKLACIPSGMMGELLYLNFEGINQIELVGMDYDPETLQDAKQLAEQLGLAQHTKLIHQDAWQLAVENEFDLISSNGLTIYESDDDKVADLYRRFYRALKPGGKLVTSFLTCRPSATAPCEWDFAHIDKSDLMRQKAIFADVIDAKWQCFRSSQQTEQQLKAAGFCDITFRYDPAKLFPTVMAVK